MPSGKDQWAYRVPFALQWTFLAPIMIGLIWALESPRWLVRHGRIEKASAVVKRIMSAKEAQDETSVANTISMMKLTNEHEKVLSAGTNYWDCFRGIDLRRTEVACLTWACQNLWLYVSTIFTLPPSTPLTHSFLSSLAAFMGYSTYL